MAVSLVPLKESTMFGKVVSLHGQNTLVFEIFPQDINEKCEGFPTLWAYCGLGHPYLDPFRSGIIVCNLNVKAVYVATNLHSVVHGGITTDVATQYESKMIGRGHTLCNEGSFNPMKKHLLVIGCDESAIVPNALSFFNF
eukprot:6564604-Ditylum_brightwellii.AAC.1